MIPAGKGASTLPQLREAQVAEVIEAWYQNTLHQFKEFHGKGVETYHRVGCSAILAIQLWGLPVALRNRTLSV
eukprot:481646-Rhodomonas_salina.1